jgi:hypothetical protein
MQLDHPSQDPFEPLIRAMLDEAFGAGLRGLATAGFRPGDEWHTEASRIFRAACFPSFKKAQQSAGAAIVELERRIRELDKEEAIKRGRRESVADLSELRTVLKNRQLVFRRLLDSMLWVLFWPDAWVLRRLRVEGGIRSISPKEVETLLQERTINEDGNADRFYLICDLTTVCQLGDLVISEWIPSRNIFRNVVAELKVGSKNVVLHKRLHDPEIATIQDALDGIAGELGAKEAKQAARIVRQEKRLENFKRVIATDEGVDPMTGHPFRMTKRPHVSKDLRDKLALLVARTKSEGSFGVTLDGCLRLLAVLPGDKNPEREGLHVALSFYRMRHGSSCAPDAPETVKQREAKTILEAPMAVNLFDFSIGTPLAMPPLLWYPSEMMLDVLMGRVKVFAQFDYERFFELARKTGIEMSFLGGKEASKIKSAKVSGPLIEYRDTRFVQVKNPKGGRLILGARFLSRTYAMLVRPRDLLEKLSGLLKEATKGSQIESR